MRSLLIVLLLVGVHGCGSSSSYTFSKPGLQQQQFRQDDFECKQLAKETVFIPIGGTFAGGPVVNEQTWLDCLAARGYTARVVEQ